MPAIRLSLRSLCAGCALLCLLAFTSHARAQLDGLFGQMQQSSLASTAQTRQLAHQMLPTTEALGADWRYAWQLPSQLSTAVPSEDAYWQRESSENMFVAVTETEARQIAQMTRQMAGMGMGLTGHDALALIVGLTADLRPIATMAAQLSMAQKGMNAYANLDPNAEPDPAALMRQIIGDLIAPYAGQSDQQLEDAFVHTMTQINQSTHLDYYRSNDWASIEAARTMSELEDKGLWVGHVKVKLAKLKPEGIDGMPKLTDAEAAAFSARMSQDVDAMMAAMKTVMGNISAQEIAEMEAGLAQIDQQIATTQDDNMRNQLSQMRSQYAEQVAQAKAAAQQEQLAAGEARVAVHRRDFGEDSYVIRLNGVSPDTPGMSIALYTGFIRNGNAVAIIELSGNFPADQMNAEMDHFLAEMDATTRAQADDF